MIITLGDVKYEVDYRMTSHGSPSSFMEPGDPPEFSIDHVYIDNVEVTKTIGDEIMDKLHNYICENYVDDGDDESDYY